MKKIPTKFEGVQKVLEIYYKSLYTQACKADRLTIKKFLASLDLPSIGEDQNNKNVSKISIKEIDSIISSHSASNPLALIDSPQNSISV